MFENDTPAFNGAMWMLTLAIAEGILIDNNNLEEILSPTIFGGDGRDSIKLDIKATR